MADDVELVAVRPFYALDWPDGTRFDYSNDDEQLLAQIHALNPADVAGYKRFLDYSAGVYEEGYRKLGTKAFEKHKRHAQGRPRFGQVSGMAIGYSIVSKFVRMNIAAGIKLPYLARRRQSDDLFVYLCADPQARARRRGVVRNGRHQPAGRGHGRLVRAPRRDLAAGRPGGRDRSRGRRREGGADPLGWRGEADAVASNGDIVASYGLIEGDARGAKRVKALKRNVIPRPCSCSISGSRGNFPTSRIT